MIECGPTYRIRKPLAVRLHERPGHADLFISRTSDRCAGPIFNTFVCLGKRHMSCRIKTPSGIFWIMQSFLEEMEPVLEQTRSTDWPPVWTRQERQPDEGRESEPALSPVHVNTVAFADRYLSLCDGPRDNSRFPRIYRPTELPDSGHSLD